MQLITLYKTIIDQTGVDNEPLFNNFKTILVENNGGFNHAYLDEAEESIELCNFSLIQRGSYVEDLNFSSLTLTSNDTEVHKQGMFDFLIGQFNETETNIQEIVY